MKKAIVVFLILNLICSTFLFPVYAQDSVSTAEDAVYNQAIDTLVGLRLIKDADKQPTEKVTRAQFADIVATTLGWNEFTAEEQVQTKKFLGYTNDPVFEEVEGWIWNESLNETSQSDENNQDLENATPFKDVLTTHKYWNSIKKVASFGLMSGDENKYFRPNDNITLIEAEKVLVYACGRGSKIGQSFPTDVLVEVARTRMNDGVVVKNTDDEITYRDVVVLLYNALEVNVYEAVSYLEDRVEYKESKTETLLSYFRKFYLTTGVVTQNRFTSLKDTKGTVNDTIFVDNVRYKTNGKNYDNFLGKTVNVYYSLAKKSDNLYTIVYLSDSGQNEELCIDAKDIEDYKNNTLTYYTERGRLKTEYIGTDIDIIYNGKALTEYTDYGDDIITPERGSIRFVNADGDSRYETVFIEDIRTVMVSAIDRDNEKIYDKLDKAPIDLINCDYEITDKTGNMLTLGDISNSSVIDVKTTLSTQGDALVRMVVNNNYVTGKITSHDSTEKKVMIDDVWYVYADIFDTSFIQMNLVMTFYLNSDDEIVWANKGSELYFAFLQSIDEFEDSRNDIRIRVYDFAADDFIVYKLAEKIVVNKSVKQEAKKIKDSVLWDSKNDKTASQIVKIKLNAEGYVCEIMSEKNADGTLVDENEIVEVPFTPCEGGLLVRVTVGMLADMYASVAYYNADTMYSIVPLTEFENDAGYYKGEVFEEGKNIKANKIYKAKKSSAIASVVLLQEDTGGLTSDDKQVITDNAPSLVTKVTKALSEEGDVCYKISGVDMRTTTSFTHKVVDDDLMKLAADLEPGDMIQFTTVGQYKYMQRMKKIFDFSDNEWTKNYGGGTKNPVNRRMDYYDGASQAIHGRVSVRLDDGEFIKIAPYVYDKDGNTGVIDDKSEYSCIYPTKLFKYYVFEKENEIIRPADVYLDLLSEEEAGYENGSKVIAWTNYGQPRTVIIYK